MLPIQNEHIEHMHEGVWLGNIFFIQNDIYENLDYFSDISFDIYSFQV